MTAREARFGKWRAAVGAIAVATGLLLAACGGGSSNSATPAASNTATPAKASATPLPAGSTFDIALSGAIQVEWKGRQSDGAAVSCRRTPSGGLEATVDGQIEGKPYSLIARQDVFAPGVYTYPAADQPFVQVVTASDPAVEWTAGGQGAGSGTVTIGGAAAKPPAFVFDVDLTPLNAQPVHLYGNIKCTAQ